MPFGHSIATPVCATPSWYNRSTHRVYNGVRMRASASRHGRLFVGTSGWVYPDWLGTVYPRQLKHQDTFAYYATHFRSVELNATFYHFPRATTVEKWRTQGGDDFTWAVKGWRWITHVKRLKGIRPDLRQFLDRVAPIAKPGVVLFQLPPSFKQDLGRLGRFLGWLPAGWRFAVEFRHNSWFAPETYEALREHRVACVGVDAPGIRRELDVRTAPFAYFRFHGSSRWYQHDYSDEELGGFALAATRHLAQGDLYVYFDNTADGHAFHNALAFRQRLSTGPREAAHDRTHAQAR